MKIVHIITSLKIAGAESALYNLLKYIRYYDDEHIVIFFYGGPNAERIKKLGVEVQKIRGLFSVYDPLALFRLYRFVKKSSPDIIHTALWSANIIGRILAKIFRIPIICDLHGSVVDQGAFLNFFERATVSIPARFVAVSKSVKKTFEEEVVQRCGNKENRNVIMSKLRLIQNGVDIEALTTKAQRRNMGKQALGFEKSDFVIGSVGRLEPIKSYDILLKAFSLFLNKLSISKQRFLCKPKLCLIGDGSEKRKLKLLAEKLKIAPSTCFAGEREDVVEFYPLFDCFVLSSQSEGLSMALLEALSFGLPLISTHNFVEHDVIEDGKNGFLINPGDVSSLEKAIGTIYENPGLAASMSRLNRVFAQERFDIKRVAFDYNELYREIFPGYVN